MQIIINWLKGSRNYSVGATIYKKFGSNDAFKKLLENGETAFSKNQLADELEKMLTPVVIPPVAQPEEKAKSREMPVSDDLILESIRSEWQPLYQRMNLLRHKLDQYGSENSPEAIAYRKPLAAEIKDLERQCMASWAKRNYYEKEGKLPFILENKLVLPEDPLELAKLLNSIKKNIRFNRKQMQDNPGEPKYAQLYLNYKEQFKTVTGKDYVEKN